MGRLFGTPWRETHRENKFPFTEQSSLRARSGGQLLEGVVLDASLYPPAGTSRYRLAKVTIASDRAIWYLGDGQQDELATAVLSFVSPEAILAFTDEHDRPAGVLVLDPLAALSIRGWGLGDHEFDAGDAEFCGSVCLPASAVGVTGLLLDDGTLLTGDVWLVGGDGVVLTQEERIRTGSCQVSIAETVLRVDVVGDPLFRRRLCSPTDRFDPPRWLQTITIVADNQTVVLTPDELGQIRIQLGANLADDSALRIALRDNQLMFEIVGTLTEGSRG
jgi:hypothetical protein